MQCPDIGRYILTDHARQAMQRRGITELDVAIALGAPEQREEIRQGRCVYQSTVALDASQRIYLIRIFVDIACDPPEVVTVYLTSKIQRYWR
jgi:hypothetical protein